MPQEQYDEISYVHPVVDEHILLYQCCYIDVQNACSGCYTGRKKLQFFQLNSFYMCRSQNLAKPLNPQFNIISS